MESANTNRARQIDLIRQAEGYPALQSRPHVFLAEDDDEIRDSLAALFAHDGFVVRASPDGERMFQWLFHERGPGSRQPDVIVTDYRMPGYTALDILECLRDRRWEVPVIVITAYGREVRDLARSLGACAVFEKPFEPDDLRIATMHCVQWQSQPIRSRRYTVSEREIVSRARRAIRSQVRDIGEDA